MRLSMLSLILCLACGGKLDSVSDAGGGDSEASISPDACVLVGQTIKATFKVACGGPAIGADITLRPDGYDANMGGGVGWSCHSASANGCSVHYSNCTRNTVIYEDCDIVSTDLDFNGANGFLATGSSLWICGKCSHSDSTIAYE